MISLVCSISLFCLHFEKEVITHPLAGFFFLIIFRERVCFKEGGPVFTGPLLYFYCLLGEREREELNFYGCAFFASGENSFTFPSVLFVII